MQCTTGSARVRLQGELGMTLLEVMIVLVIIGGITAAVSLARIRVPTSMQLQATAEVLAADLREARSRAITQGSVAGIRFDLGRRSYTSLPSGPARALPKEITVMVVIVDGQNPQDSGILDVVFSAAGAATGSTIVLTRDGRHRSVHMDWLSGRVAIIP